MSTPPPTSTITVTPPISTPLSAKASRLTGTLLPGTASSGTLIRSGPCRWCRRATQDRGLRVLAGDLDGHARRQRRVAGEDLLAEAVEADIAVLGRHDVGRAVRVNRWWRYRTRGPPLPLRAPRPVPRQRRPASWAGCERRCPTARVPGRGEVRRRLHGGSPRSATSGLEAELHVVGGVDVVLDRREAERLFTSGMVVKWHVDVDDVAWGRRSRLGVARTLVFSCPMLLAVLTSIGWCSRASRQKCPASCPGAMAGVCQAKVVSVLPRGATLTKRAISLPAASVWTGVTLGC